MKSLDTFTEAPRVVVFSSRARASVVAETLQHGENETGGLLLGHRCGPVWYIVESVDPGPGTTRGRAHFSYDQEYLTHLINKLRWYYQKPLDLLGLWHRHPGSFDSFSAPDRATNGRFVDQCKGQYVLSALVNLDPFMRLTVYAVSGTGERLVSSAVGEDLFPPVLLAYRGGAAAASTLTLLATALADYPGALEDRLLERTSRLEELLALAERDLAFLTPLCAALRMKESREGGLELEEDGRPLLTLEGGGDSATVTLVGTSVSCRYHAGLISRAVTARCMRNAALCARVLDDTIPSHAERSAIHRDYFYS